MSAMAISEPAHPSGPVTAIRRSAFRNKATSLRPLPTAARPKTRVAASRALSAPVRTTRRSTGSPANARCAVPKVSAVITVSRRQRDRRRSRAATPGNSRPSLASVPVKSRTTYRSTKERRPGWRRQLRLPAVSSWLVLLLAIRRLSTPDHPHEHAGYNDCRHRLKGIPTAMNSRNET